MKKSSFPILLLALAVLSLSNCGDDASNSIASSAEASATSSSADSSSSTGASASESSTIASNSATPASITASAAAGNGYNTITWSSATGATSYYLYWSTSSDLSTLNGTRIANATSPYTQSNLTNGTKIYYLVSAVYSGSEIGYSTVLNATPVGVSGVTAAAGNKYLTLSWGAITSAASYNLYYSTSSSITTSNSSRVLSVSSPYNLIGLTNGTTYYILVTGVVSGSETSASAKISKAPVNPPSAPTKVAITITDTTPAAPAVIDYATYELPENSYRDDLTWTAVSGATGYAIYWSGSSAVSTTNYSGRETVTTSYYQNNHLSTAQYYIVTALIENSESSASSYVKGGGIEIPILVL